MVLFCVASCVSLQRGGPNAQGVGSDSFCPVRWGLGLSQHLHHCEMLVSDCAAEYCRRQEKRGGAGEHDTVAGSDVTDKEPCPH